LLTRFKKMFLKEQAKKVPPPAAPLKKYLLESDLQIRK